MAEEILSTRLADFANEVIAEVLGSVPLGEDIHVSPLVSEILYRRNEPDRWAAICEIALRFSEIPFERRIALEIELVNGIRRMPGRWDIERARRVLEQASGAIKGLSVANPHKARLGGLALYHGGLVEHAGGNFLEAAFCHQLTAALPGASSFSQAIANFMAVNELVNHALVETGVPSEELLGQFADRDREFQSVLDMTTGEGRRWNINRLCFRQRVAWLCGQQMSAEDIDEIFRGRREFGSSFDHCLALLDGALRVVKHLIPGDLGDALNNMDLDWKSEAWLVVAEYDQYDRDRARRNLLDLESKGHGGHVARAIARRMLEGPEAR